MTRKKSLLSFVKDSVVNDYKTSFLVISVFGFGIFIYYGLKSLNLFIEDLNMFPDGYTIACLSFTLLTILGIGLTIHTIVKNTPKVYLKIKSSYYSYLFIWYSEEIMKLYDISNEISKKMLALYEVQKKESEIAYYIFMSDSWRKHDFYLAYLFEKEKYEDLAVLKRADDKRTEFEKTNDYNLLKNSAEEARLEIAKLEESKNEVSKTIAALEKKEEVVRRKFGFR